MFAKIALACTILIRQEVRHIHVGEIYKHFTGYTYKITDIQQDNQSALEIVKLERIDDKKLTYEIDKKTVEFMLKDTVTSFDGKRIDAYTKLDKKIFNTPQNISD